jgi:hypothetical protein
VVAALPEHIHKELWLQVRVGLGRIPGGADSSAVCVSQGIGNFILQSCMRLSAHQP